MEQNVSRGKQCIPKVLDRVKQRKNKTKEQQKHKKQRNKQTKTKHTQG